MITLPVLLAGASLLLFLSLPYLTNRYLLPLLLVDLPFTDKELSLATISPWQVQGSLSLAGEGQPTLFVPRFELDYTPGTLRQKNLSELLIDSASLQLDIAGGRPVISGLTDSRPAMSKKDNTSGLLLPLAVEHLRLRNFCLRLGGDLKKPLTMLIDGRFDLGFTEQPQNNKLLQSLTGQIEINGDLRARSTIAMTEEENGYLLRLTIETADLDWLGRFFPKMQGAELSGQLVADLAADINKSLNSITGYQVALKLPGFFYQDDLLTVDNRSATQPITLKLAGNPDKTSYDLTGLLVSKPEKSALDLQGELHLQEAAFKGSGRLLPARTGSEVKFNYSGNHSEMASRINYRLTGDAFTLQDDVSVSPFSIEGEAEMSGPGVTGTAQGHFPEISLSKKELKLINLSFRLPLRYPPVPESAKGTEEDPAGELKIDQLRYKNVNSGKFRADLMPSPEGLNYKALITTPFVPGLQLGCQGSATFNQELAASCRLNETKFNSATFPSFLKLPKDLSLTGKLAAGGQFQLQENGFAGKLSLDIHDGRLEDGKNTLSDISLHLTFPRLPLLQSSPSQLCSIGSADLGKIKLSKAKIHFRIEDQQSIFLERFRANWCGGKVETGSFPLSTDMQELETTLYCDRLGFTELLSQFGIDKTEGQGSLNGRLPVTISKQGVVFDDGFLFSTPGNSGIVRFNDTTQLRRGLPDISNSAYLDYSMKALENFAYNWTKLSFNSQNDDLLITMQLDGKPADPLPFGYSKGRIVPSDQGPGLQHPIRLDVNFRIPMQALLQYGKNIQSIMEKM